MKHRKKTLASAVIGLLFSSLEPLPARADEVVKKLPAGGAADLLENPKNPVGDAGGAMKVKKDCTTSEGKTVIKGDPAYEACLKEKLEKPKK